MKSPMDWCLSLCFILLQFLIVRAEVALSDPCLRCNCSGTQAFIFISEDTNPGFLQTLNFTGADRPVLNNSVLVFNSTDNAVYLKRKLDHELESLRQENFDCPGKLSLRLTIIVGDVNDEKPVFQQKIYFCNTTELQQGQLLPTIRITATDADSTRLTYTILDGPDKSFFSLDGSTGLVTLLRPLDYEQQQRYFITIQVTDGKFTDVANLTVVLRDSDDERPKFTQTLYNGWVFTNASQGDLVRLDKNISAYDPDRGINEKIIYRIDGSSCPSWFRIDEQTGLILVNGTELEVNTCAVDVVALEEADLKSSQPVRVTINVLKGREPPPRFDESHYTYYISEDTEVFTNIIRLSVRGEGVIFKVEGSQDFFVPSKSSYIQLAKAQKAKETPEHKFNVTARQPALGTSPLATDSTSMTVYITSEEATALSSLAIGMIAACSVLAVIVIVIIVLFCCYKRPRSERQKLDRVSPMKELHTPLGAIETDSESACSPRPPPDGEPRTPISGSPSMQHNSKQQASPVREPAERQTSLLQAVPEEGDEEGDKERDSTESPEENEHRKHSVDSRVSDSSGTSVGSSFNLPRNPDNYNDAKSVDDLRQKRVKHRGDNEDGVAERKTSYLDELNFKNTKRDSIQADLARAMDLAQRRDSAMLEQDESLRQFQKRRGSRRDTRASLHSQSSHPSPVRLPPPLTAKPPHSTAVDQLRPSSATGQVTEPEMDSFQALMPSQPRLKVRRDSSRPLDAQPLPPQSPALTWATRKPLVSSQYGKGKDRKKRTTAWDEKEEYDFKTYEELTLDGEKLKMFSY